jgi:hypothetical protein
MNNKRQIKCGLLNFEGDVLWALKVALDSYEIYDQYKKQVAVLSTNKFIDFLDGCITVTDSNGKEWNYRQESNDAKYSHRKLLAFINYWGPF